MKRFETVLFLGVLVLAACGGSGGGGGSVDPGIDAEGGVPKSGLAASFVPNNPNPNAPDTVWMDQASAVGDTITVEFLITSTNNLHTVGFDVVFDDAAIKYLGYNQGSLFEQGNNDPSYLVDSQTGRVVVGISRSGSTETDAVGSVTAIEIVFEVRTSGTHAVSLANQDLLRAPVGGNDAEIIDVDWWGGNAIAN